MKWLKCFHIVLLKLYLFLKSWLFNVAHLHRGGHQCVVNRWDVKGGKDVAVHVIDTSDVINVSSIPEKGLRLGGEEITIADQGQSQIVYNGI